jgi:hypothetical protein
MSYIDTTMVGWEVGLAGACAYYTHIDLQY